MLLFEAYPKRGFGEKPGPISLENAAHSERDFYSRAAGERLCGRIVSALAVEATHAGPLGRQPSTSRAT